MKASVCIATHDKPKLLRNTLDSICVQHPTFRYEVIVVDDGPPNDETMDLVAEYMEVDYHLGLSRFKYRRLDREPTYRNPAAARNVAYRMAKGEVIIAQSDDVIHTDVNVIQRLVDNLEHGAFCIAKVVNVDERGNVCCDPSGSGYGDRLEVYTSSQKRRPLFFLGSLWRWDLYAVGGNDEEFTSPSGEDRWFGMCLENGLRLRAKYLDNVVGHHQMHPHCNPNLIAPSQALVRRKVQQARHTGQWVSSGGPWEYPIVDGGGIAREYPTPSKGG